MAIKLNKREKIAVGAGAGALVFFAILQFLVFPLVDRNDRLTRTLAARSQELVQIRTLQAQYHQTTDNAQQAQLFMKTRKRGFTLFSFLETLAGQTGIKVHIAYMRPTTTAQKDSPYRHSMVEMKLQDIAMSQLLPYLHGIETAREMMAVKRLSITKSEQQDKLITAVFQVETLEK
jgi:general secretion pathway protein M